jgi:GNAT superfamily N-acetyltransferase
MIIRKAKKGDEEQLARLYLQFWEVHENKNPLHQLYYKINYKNCLKDMKETIQDKDYSLYVAEKEGEIWGCVLIIIKKQSKYLKIKKYGYVEECFVDKKHRRKGVATKLVNYALDCFKKKGCKYAQIAVEIDLPIAKKAWESLGFKPETIELVKRLR